MSDIRLTTAGRRPGDARRRARRRCPPDRYLEAVTRAQAIFVVALAAITVLITAFAVYVASSTMWSDRWYERRPPRR